MVLPRGAVGLSAVCDCGFPDHTHLLFLGFVTHSGVIIELNSNKG